MRPRPTGTTRAFHPSPFPSAKACITADAAPTVIRSNAVPFKIPKNASLRLQCALRRSSALPTPSDGPMMSSSSSAFQRTLGLLVLADYEPSYSLKRASALIHWKFHWKVQSQRIFLSSQRIFLSETCTGSLHFLINSTPSNSTPTTVQHVVDPNQTLPRRGPGRRPEASLPLERSSFSREEGGGAGQRS